jgi:hypothetical protein
LIWDCHRIVLYVAGLPLFILWRLHTTRKRNKVVTVDGDDVDSAEKAQVDFTFLSEDYKDEGLLCLWEFVEIMRKISMSMVSERTCASLGR